MDGNSHGSGIDEAALRRFLVDNLSLTSDLNQYESIAELKITLRLRDTSYPSGHPREYITIDTVRESFSIPEREYR